MTREEAITALGDRNCLLWGMSKEEQKYYSEALDMAISALSAEGGKDCRDCGEWIRLYPDEELEMYECSLCCEEIGYKSRFCPNCGADMRGNHE